MAMNWYKLNEPWDKTPYGPYKRCFFALEFDNDAIGGVDGQTYDPTNHYTTRIDLSKVVNANLFDLWGITKILGMQFSCGSSDANAATSGGTSNDVGKFKASFVESGNYIKFIMCGAGTDDASGGNDETEMNDAADSLSAVRLTGYLIGV